MTVILNGQPRPLEPGTTLPALLAALELEDKRVAVEINGHIVPRGDHAATPLADGDRIEIVHAIGGG
ncbi:MAG: sulfur carrier protein ThiS [Oceanococcaceae bacterium]